MRTVTSIARLNFIEHRYLVNGRSHGLKISAIQRKFTEAGRHGLGFSKSGHPKISSTISDRCGSGMQARPRRREYGLEGSSTFRHLPASVLLTCPYDGHTVLAQETHVSSNQNNGVCNSPSSFLPDNSIKRSAPSLPHSALPFPSIKPLISA
ncbi:hypothetical protein BDN67DRAFT_352736 [Paxillus ammoniavirescens]|nr:hypothetical protein BDN67DRAFT_352736 [Paxillus ammoniavirescens]